MARLASTAQAENQGQESAAARFLEFVSKHPHLKDKLYRQLLITLHTRELVTIDQIYSEANKLESPSGVDRNHNVSLTTRWNENEKSLIHEITLDYADRYLSVEDIDEIAALTHRRDAAKALEDILSLPNVSHKLLAKNVVEFCQLPGSKQPLPPSEETGIRAALIRHFVSDQLEFIGIAKRHFRIGDMLPIVNNSIGPKTGIGRIGGKAAGMFLSHNILVNALRSNPDFKSPWYFKIPESYFLRSDLYQDFIYSNGLTNFYDEKYKPISVVRQEYPMIREVFKNAEFDSRIIRKLTQMLKTVGKHPLIVRSSSLLEDNFESAFSGKYDSIFLANQGTLKDRLAALLNAIADVYASTLGPEPILYRQEKDLLDYDERMAVMIQKVIGIRYNNYFLPAFSGVAFSRNEYRWNKRIRKEDGLVRLVMGLGTRAVDRVGSDYPRMIALSAPTLRPEGSTASIQKYSQKQLDVIDLNNNKFARIRLADLLGEEPFPDLDKIVSIKREDSLRPPIGKLVSEDPRNLVITFKKLLVETDFAAGMNWVVKTLAEAYKSPIDIEFAIVNNEFYILQCRPLSRVKQKRRVRIPDNIPTERVVFSSEKDTPNGLVENIEYIVYVDPMDYGKLKKSEDMTMLGKLIGKLNDKLYNRSFILMGPGRWGSNDINLGIPVKYSDINHAKVLIEIARAKGDYIPEVSFGTHFFQDLVEGEILYVPLYPDDPKVIFNEEILRNSNNSLNELLPGQDGFLDILRVIHVPKISNGKYLHMYLDGIDDRGKAFLGKKVKPEGNGAPQH